jgi:putative ABC transport system substrate-binding protein
MDRVRRRDVLISGGALLAALLPARAQQPVKVYRIGYLSAPTRASVERSLGTFLRALRELGWVEGQNLVIEYRWAEGEIERLHWQQRMRQTAFPSS